MENKIKYDVQKDIRTVKIDWFIYVIVFLITVLVAVTIIALILTVGKFLSGEYNEALNTCMNKGFTEAYCRAKVL